MGDASSRSCLVIALVLTLGLIGLTVMHFGRPHTHTGRTTLMLPPVSPGVASPDPYPDLAKAVNLASSPTVVSNAAATLRGLGVKLTEQELSASLIVRGNGHTGIMSIEVKRASPTEAKAAAGAIAAELKNEWAGKHQSRLGTVVPAYVEFPTW